MEHALTGSTGKSLSLSFVSRRLVMQSICQLDFVQILRQGALMLIDAASVAQTVSMKRASRAHVSRRRARRRCSSGDQSANQSAKSDGYRRHFHFRGDSAI